jgi:hypothetical protein
MMMFFEMNQNGSNIYRLFDATKYPTPTGSNNCCRNHFYKHVNPTDCNLLEIFKEAVK